MQQFERNTGCEPCKAMCTTGHNRLTQGGQRVCARRAQGPPPLQSILVHLRVAHESNAWRSKLSRAVEPKALRHFEPKMPSPRVLTKWVNNGGGMYFIFIWVGFNAYGISTFYIPNTIKIILPFLRFFGTTPLNTPHPCPAAIVDFFCSTFGQFNFIL